MVSAEIWSMSFVVIHGILPTNDELYSSGRQPTARVPSVARGTIFSGTLSELKYNNYDLINFDFLI
jgi:hypothetical protein